jgi:hypothetical protein
MMAISRAYQVVIPFVVLGAVLGILVIHPVAMTAYWFEIGVDADRSGHTLWAFLRDRLLLIFLPHQFPMSGVYATIGGLIGFGFGLFSVALHRETRAVHYFEKELAQSIPSLIAAGENKRVEFKASVRWDHNLSRVNRSLETVAAKALAGFFNHQGGILLVGVTDGGEVVGLESDYRTLRRQDRDGFERCIADIVKAKLGGDLCPLLHITFYRVEDRDVCLIAVEPAQRPVYCEEGKSARFFVRAGNSTRELDVRDAISHAAIRWPRK